VLKKSFLKTGISKGIKNSTQKLFLFFLFVCLGFLFPFSNSFLYTFYSVLQNFFFSFNFCLVLLLSFFVTWTQLQKRFNQARVFYEEASWYDGQFWQKPVLVLKNDRFLSTQQIQPFLQKLFTHFSFFLFSNLVFFFFFFLQ
jgi:hypothetical protein